MTDVLGRALPPTDRELLLIEQEEQTQEAYALDLVARARAEGMGLAALALGMWQGLDGIGLTRHEKMGLIMAGLRGR